MKSRLDKLLVDQGHAASRERAQALILAGRVLVNEQRVDKPGVNVPEDATIRLLGSDLKYVSRARTVAAPDCMLQAGAATVLAVDTGYGQIAQRLRDDPRVSLRERTNARKLEAGELVARGQPAPGFLAMDVSFISATLVLPAVLSALSSDGDAWRGTAVVLIKPQFEAGRAHVGKGGIVRDPEARRMAIERVSDCVAGLGGVRLEVIDSPIHGMEGNHEYLLRAIFGGG